MTARYRLQGAEGLWCLDKATIELEGGVWVINTDRSGQRLLVMPEMLKPVPDEPKWERVTADVRLSFTGYLVAVANAQVQVSHWRVGQTYWNTLYSLRPDLAEQTRDTAIDCFHQDSRLDHFLKWLRENWEQ